MGMAMTMVPINQMSAQGIIQVDWHPESLISANPAMKVIDGTLSLPRCEEQGYAAIGFTTETSFEVKNPNYDPLDDQNETTFVNSYLIVMSRTQEGLDPDIQFFDIVAPDGVYGDFSTELLGSKTFEWSVGGPVYYHSFFFKVDHTVTVPNHVFEDVSDFGGFPIEARFYHEGLNSIIWSSDSRFYLYSGSMVGFDLEDYQEFSDVADLTYLGQRTSKFSAETHVLIDGTITPQKLSDYVNPELIYYADPPLLAHPAVACYQEEGSGIRNILMVEGDLIVDIDYCYFHRLNTKHIDPDPLSNLIMKYIYMGPDARIIIDSGVVFTIDRTLILSCNTLWNSIVVKDLGTLNIHESYIMDGIHAIQVEEGGTVNISRNIFDANHISLYSPPSGGGRYSLNHGPFFGNEFVNESDLKAYPQNYTGFVASGPYVGIQLNDINNFIASGVGHLGQVEINSFEGIPTAIHMVNSGLDIKNYSIKDALDGYGYGGYGIILENSQFVQSTIRGNGKASSTPNIKNVSYVGILANNGINRILDNVIEEVETGVEIGQNVSFSLNAINGNKIDASHYGVFYNITRSGGLRIIDNEINMDRNSQISSGGSVYGVYVGGVGLHNSVGTKIEDNVVNMNNNSHVGIGVSSVGHSHLRGNAIEDVVATNEFKGISVLNSPNALVDYNNVLGKSGPSYSSSAISLASNPAFRLNCNTTGKTAIGIHVVLENNGSELKGNVIDEHYHYGMMYGTQGVSGMDAHITGLQFHHGNIWDFDYEAAQADGALHTEGMDDAEKSLFFVNPEQNSKYTTTRVPNDWFEEEETSIATWQCPEVRPENPRYDVTPKTVPTDLDTRIAVSDQPFKDYNFESSVTYIARRNLYHRIMEGYYDSLALSGTALDTFLTEVQNTSIEVFHDVIRSMEDELSLDQSVLDQLNDLSDNMNWNIRELIRIDSLAWIDTAAVDTTQWLVDRGIVTEKIHALSSEMDSVYAANEPDPSSIVSTLNSALNGVSVSHPPEAIEKQILIIIVDKVFVGDLDFTGNQRSKIIEISEYCPSYGGTGVYWARNLRTTFDSAVVYVDTLCAGGFEERRVLPVKEGEEGILIYPNPGTDDVYVEFNGLEFDRWEIIDLHGRVIRHGTLPHGEEETQLRVDFLKNGQYILRFTSDENQISKPLIIFSR